MAELDPTTGIGTRGVFARQVNQAGLDQDPCAVALLALPTLNRLVPIAGTEACDALVRDVARALTLSISASTTLARTGDDEFGLLVADFRDDNIDRWISPLVTSCRAAIDKWHAHNDHLVVGTLPVPDFKVGVAVGADEMVWERAQRARQVAVDQVSDNTVVKYRSDDMRIAAAEADEAHEQAAIGGLANNTLTAVRQSISSVRQPEHGREWHRLAAALPDNTAIDRQKISPRVARRVEQWLLSVVPETMGNGQDSIVTVPVDAEVLYGRTIASDLFPTLERMRLSPRRFVFELDQETLIANIDRSLSALKQLDKIGARSALVNFDGGWTSWEVVLESPIKLVTPTASLLESLAASNRNAMRILAAISATSDEHNIELSAPHTTVEIPRKMLTTIGFSNVSHQPEVVTRPNIEPAKFGRLSQG